MAEQPLMLEIQTGKFKGRRIRVSDNEMIIGRGEGVTIRISSAEVSREHCKLIADRNKIRVIDLESRNGTFVDGRPVAGERLLSPGGSLTVGPITFILIGNEIPAPLTFPGVRLKGKKGSDPDLSDDEIANWLSDTELPVVKQDSPTKTAILQRNQSSPPAPQQQSPVLESQKQSPLGVPPTPPGLKREFKSVAEEAQEIIRRHLDKQKESAPK